MTTTSTPNFADELKKAANKFKHEATAFSLFSSKTVKGDIFIKLRLQAPDIMAQFVGQVHYGRDPKGVLFYNSQDDLLYDGRYRVFQYTERAPWKTVKVEFYTQRSNPPVEMARWVARVDTSKYTLPPDSNTMGTGKWRTLKASTSQADIQQQTGDRVVSLKHPSISKEGYFEVPNTSGFKTTGVLIFPNIKTLVPTTNCVADYLSDRIVFHPPNQPDAVIALCLPREPIRTIGEGTSPATWENYTPDNEHTALRFAATVGLVCEEVEEAVPADEDVEA